MKTFVKLILIIVILVALGGGIWYLYSNTQERTVTLEASKSNYQSLADLISDSDFIAFGSIQDTGTTTDKGIDTVTDYSVKRTAFYYPGREFGIPAQFTIRTAGGIVGKTTYTLPDAPVLEKDKTYLLFTKYNNDGKLHLNANGYAVATYSADNKVYSLPSRAGLATGQTFSPDDLNHAIDTILAKNSSKTAK